MNERKLMLRDRIVGVLLRHARLREGRSKAECAEALGVPPARLEAYESGEASISLPELEVLAYVLNAPINHFLDPQSELKSGPDSLDFGAVLSVRHRVIGILLREARREAGLSQEDLANLLGSTAEQVSNYEGGEEAIPLAQLELLARHLELPFEHFLDDSEGTLATWHRRQELDACFRELPPELQRFAADRNHVPYLRLAQKVAQMPARNLQEVAQTLLDIPC